MLKRNTGVLVVLGLIMASNFAGAAAWSVNAHEELELGNRKAIAGVQPQLASLKLFFKGQPVDQLITENKAKRYLIDLTGSGFDPGSSVVINERIIPTTFVSATELTAKLRGNLTSAPGELIITVINSEGQISNALSVDVISNPADLSIFSVSSDFGTSGTQMKLTGVGFTPTGNRVRFKRSAEPGLTGLTTDLASDGGRTITFEVPGTVCPPCFFSTPPCLLPCFRVAPGDYQISVVNRDGISNSLRFLVSSSEGPIGVWGGDHIRVEVSDLQVRVTGLCFGGVTNQTVQLDPSGSFDLTGQIFTFVGPAGLPHPASYSGSISGNVMTLVIAQTDSKSLLGPFTLVFGNDVHVVQPCL